MEGPIGGVVLTVASLPSPSGTRSHDVERIVVEYHRVEAVIRDEPEGGTRQVVLDAQDRRIELENREIEIVVAQFQVPVGELLQLRFFPRHVIIQLRDGSEHDLAIDGPGLPSWRRTGWKIVPANASDWTIIEDELIGLRGRLDFEDRLVAPPPGSEKRGWKIKPTLPAEAFVVNPAEHEAGIFADRMDVVLVPGSTGTDADALAEALGATILYRPTLTTWYRFRLPVSIIYEDAEAFLLDQPEVHAVLPAVNFAMHQGGDDTDEPSRPAFEISRITEARDLAASTDPRGFIGSHHVKVGVIDTGVDYTLSPLLDNIRINQHVLPELTDLFPDGIAPFDCDPPADETLDLEAGDGLITGHDLSCAAADIGPREIFDGQEEIVADNRIFSAMLEDPRWVPQPPVIDTRTGHENDLIGWNFMADHEEHWSLPPQGTRNDPMDSAVHGTRVAGIVGAGGVGVNDRVSIVPIRAAISQLRDPGQPFPSEHEITIPHPAFVEALRYAELRALDVVNVSMSLTLVEDGVDHRCGTVTPIIDGQASRQGFDRLGGRDLANAMKEAVRAYEPVFDQPSRTLYVFSAPHTSYDFSDEGVFMAPVDVLRQVANVRDNIVVVGSTPGGERRHNLSSYGEGIDLYAAHVWQTYCLQPPGRCEVGGTSYAAAGVSASVALLLAHDVTLQGNAAGIRQRLLETATSASGMEWCLDHVGPGLVLDAERLLRGPE